MALTKSVYNLLFRRTSTFAISVMIGAVVFERMFDQAGNAMFDQLNHGKLWKHIKHKAGHSLESDEDTSAESVWVASRTSGKVAEGGSTSFSAVHSISASAKKRRQWSPDPS
ncbi:hypothetical protein AGOR_G00250480 [Albula goreensis]|uniref:Cytochrome b-c1 complex subunit 9 n=1 Tax=Albula goreensis TaxID=1534307 RepID=A0A8T3CEW0_9TELE|nr:hypothetical protein AGOR_G00250480 [Albula goreensis]